MTRVTFMFDNIVLLKNKIETIDENLTKTIRLLGDMNGRVTKLESQLTKEEEEEEVHKEKKQNNCRKEISWLKETFKEILDETENFALCFSTLELKSKDNEEHIRNVEAGLEKMKDEKRIDTELNIMEVDKREKQVEEMAEEIKDFKEEVMVKISKLTETETESQSPEKGLIHLFTNSNQINTPGNHFNYATHNNPFPSNHNYPFHPTKNNLCHASHNNPYLASHNNPYLTYNDNTDNKPTHNNSPIDDPNDTPDQDPPNMTNQPQTIMSNATHILAGPIPAHSYIPNYPSLATNTTIPFYNPQPIPHPLFPGHLVLMPQHPTQLARQPGLPGQPGKPGQSGQSGQPGLPKQPTPPFSHQVAVEACAC
eukprot:GFUD01131013.1.p1 GENE.GFUD01131013.1~~GFUD01131013.1.p1  ORF type:complete len:368 (-),score=110.86 GFUD01131013.1:51-1154(-)